MKIMKWKLVPEEPTNEMKTAAIGVEVYPESQACLTWEEARAIYESMIAAAPQPEHDRMTKEDAQAMQDWKGMDGAIAFHLIERHAEGWHQVGEMMSAWLEANRVPNV